MKTLEVLKKARFNTALLAFSFATTAVGASLKDDTVFAVIGVLAAALTVRDAFQVHNAVKEAAKGVTDGN